ncbi:hypothetical protein ASD06_09670 [Angustibacter sp. Root456]|nr:hypothetical protein ASD06_09670 [Angustibacter sp. Root456]
MARLVSAPADGAGREPLGSAADEAARLAEAVHAWWAGRSQDDTSAPSAQAAPGGEPASSGTCRYCPLCRGVAAVHALRPEVLAHLVTAAESVAAALRELAREDAPPARSHGDQPSGRAHRPRSVRIPVDDGERAAESGASGSEDVESQEGH